MASHGVEESLRADLLMSSPSGDEAANCSQKENLRMSTNCDPILESLRSIQKTMSTIAGNVSSLGERMSNIEGKVRKFDVDGAKKSAAVHKIKQQNMVVPREDRRHIDAKTVTTNGRSLFEDSKEPKEMSVKNATSETKSDTTSQAKMSSAKCQPQKPEVIDKKSSRVTHGRVANESKIAAKKDHPPHKSGAVASITKPEAIPKTVGVVAVAKVKSVSLLPLNVCNKGEHSKKYIELSDDSDDSYDEVFRRSEPITGPVVEIDEIMHKAASFRAADLKEKEMGAGYRRMISTSAGRISDPQPVAKEASGKASVLKRPVVRAVPIPFDSPAAAPVRVAGKRPMRENADILPKRQRTVSSDSDKSFAELLASVQRMPDTPTPPRPAVSAETAMAAAKSTAQKWEKGGANQVRVRTNPEKVSSGRIGVPIVAAPPMVGHRPKSGPVTVTASNPQVSAPASATASETDSRDPTRCTDLIEVAKRGDGKEVCVEGELKREKGETVPYVNLVLATGGRARKRSLKFSMRATTMAKLVRGEAFNEVMMALRELDPTNRNCELWV